eukprot:m.529754 g.529754  ORF g.529754 m.529754 type:complete len:383 (-) comp22021_c0_seq1:1645-2793(-)
MTSEHSRRKVYADSDDAIRQSRSFILGSFYASTFFGGMCLMEIALEAAGRWYVHVEALSATVTLFQFFGCLVLPLVLQSAKCLLCNRIKTWKDGISVPSGLSIMEPKSGLELLKEFPWTNMRMLGLYLILSILVSGATALATASLRYVGYTTKIAFKSAKLVPTMVVATCTSGRVYGLREYTAAVLLGVGAGAFVMQPGMGASTTASAASASTGVAMLLAAITCDAFVPNAQSALMRSDATLTPAQLMVNTNVVGLFLAATWILVNGNMTEVIAASFDSPWFLAHMALIGACLAVAVLSYTLLIEHSGPVVAVGVATVRKAATMALSHVIFPKAITPLQVLGLASLLCGIVLTSDVGKQAVERWLRTPPLPCGKPSPSISNV